MTVVVLVCGENNGAPPHITAPVHHLGDIPSQRELKFLSTYLSQALPEDPTPSLADIARSPEVAHQGAPAPAPQQEFLTEALRFIICGSDAAVAAVLTRLMRVDGCWAEVAYRPRTRTSTLSRAWGLDQDSWDDSWEHLATAPAQPTPLIRDDAGHAVAGEATVSSWEDTELYGEIIVDSQQLCAGMHPDSRRPVGVYGARLIPMLTAPGLMAAPLRSGRAARRHWLRTIPAHLIDSTRLLQGRALQAGGEQLKVTIDGVARPRPVERATFYRHLRDIQVVRP